MGLVISRVVEVEGGDGLSGEIVQREECNATAPAAGDMVERESGDRGSGR